MRRRMIIAPFYRDAKLFERMMYDKGEFQSGDKIYYAQRIEHLRGMRLGEGMDQVQTWFLQGHWPCRTHGEIDQMNIMEHLAKIYAEGDIRYWFT